MGRIASPNPQTMQITAHLSATTTFAGDANMTATTDFTVFGELLWMATVSAANSNCVLVQDRSLGGVTISAGALVALNMFGATLAVSFSGKVSDGGVATVFDNMTLAQWSPTAAARSTKKTEPRRKQPPRR